MKIGDFAKACKTNISVLRHYDKVGLLKPLIENAEIKFENDERVIGK